MTTTVGTSDVPPWNQSWESLDAVSGNGEAVTGEF